MARNQNPLFDPRARFINIQIRERSPDEATDNPAEREARIISADEAKTFPSFAAPHSRELLVNEPRSKGRKIGKCIYCGAREFRPGTGRPLSEEHIVPEGLGARLVLEEASCEDCAGRIKRYETAIQKNMFAASRLRLGIRRKRRKRCPAEEASAYLMKAIVEGKEVEISVPPDIHPTMLALVQLDPPGALTGRPRNIGGVNGHWAHVLTHTHKITLAGFPHFALRPFDTMHFCQLLAKIAHGYSVLVLGIDGFKPALTSAILSNSKKHFWKDRYHFIGGDSILYAPSDALHTLGWRIEAVDDEHVLVISIRLFANLGSPVYQAAAGTLNPEQLEQALSVEAAQKHSSGRSPSNSR